MIVLREKEYAKINMRRLFQLKNGIGNKIDNAGLVAGNAIRTNVLGQRVVQPPNFRFHTPVSVSNAQADRVTQAGQRILDKVKNPKRTMSNAALLATKKAEAVVYNPRPGTHINKGVKLAIENPINVVSHVADVGLGTAIASVNPAAGAAYLSSPVGLGTVGMATEQAMKRKIPAYTKFTKGLGDRYAKSKMARSINELPSTTQISQYVGSRGGSLFV